MTAPSIATVKAVVAEDYGIAVAALEAPTRARAIAWPRQEAMWLCRQLTSRSQQEIGRAFGGRDHTTVRHAVRAVEARLTRAGAREGLQRLVWAVEDRADACPDADAPTRKPWTADDDRILAEGYAAGRPVNFIACELGRSRNAVIGRANRFGLKHARPFNRRDPLPEEPIEPPTPPVAVEPAADDETDPPPWRCRERGCCGTRQPGRDFCAECITEKRRAAWRQ